MSSYDTYLEEQLKKEKKKAEEDNAAYEADNEALKKQTFATLEQSADAAAGVYRQGIEDAPLESRALYDQNAMREAVDRKKIQESLANMGMTDSGISSSMQTALAVQKGRADNQVRADEQARIREMESAIDQIYANMELEKASQGLAIDQDTAAYKRNRLQAAETQATQTATSLYNTEVEAATAAAEQEQKWLQQQLSSQQDTAKLRSDYVKLLMTREENPLDSETAWQEAYKAYPDTPMMSQAQYAYYMQYLNSGYSGDNALAMSRAYANAIAAGGTETQAANAAMSSLLTAVDEEYRGTGIELAHVTLTNLSTDDAIGRMNWLTQSNRDAYTDWARRKGKEVSADCVEYATAIAIGTDYGAIVTSANAQLIGEALARNFSGIYLEVALSYAGLE